MKNQRLDGIACLYTLKKNAKKLKEYPDLHVNIWEGPSGKDVHGSKFPFLDIGLMIPKDTYSMVDSVSFIFPEKVTRDNIEDLSTVLKENEAINAIFNEIGNVTDTNSGFLVHNEIDKDKTFCILKIKDALEVESKKEENHKERTVIKLKISSLQEILDKHICCIEEYKDLSRMYIRFRIKSISPNIYKLEFIPKDKVLQSSWKTEQIIDFRFNVKRGLPLDIIGTKNNINMMKFNKIHLFLMKPVQDEIKFEDKNFKSCRSLENETFWDNYIKIKDNTKENKDYIRRCLGYQWSAKKRDEVDIEEFSVLARFQITKFTIKRYLFIMLIAGMTGSFLANIVWFLLFK